MQRFDMVGRFQGGYTRKRKQTLYIVIHHAAALYNTLTGAEDVQAVANYHTHIKKWPGIGYHTCLAEVETGGRIGRYDVSDPDMERAHVWGWNDRAIGVSCLTNFKQPPEEKWRAALADVVAGWLKKYPRAAIVGHCEIAMAGHATVCPGADWHLWKADLLERVNVQQDIRWFQVKEKLSDEPIDNFAAVRVGPGLNYREADINGVPYRLAPLTIWQFDDITGPWVHLENDMGFVHASLLQPIQAPAPPDDLAIGAAPRISRGLFIEVLRRHRSPALEAGDSMYSICVRTGIDPACLLGIFGHESHFGTTGICASYNTCSPGNVKTLYSGAMGTRVPVDGRGLWAVYPSWDMGTQDMCDRLQGRYIARGLDTIRKAIAVWAPSSDGNYPEHYIADVLAKVRSWQYEDQTTS